MFESSGWYDSVSKTLNVFDVVHPFETVHYLGFDYQPHSSLESIVKHPESHCSSGHVWAFQKSVWTQLEGLYPYSLIGGDDIAFWKHIGIPTTRFSSSTYLEQIQGPTLPISYQCMEGNIFYLAHGNLNRRQYISRNLKIQDFLDKKGIHSIQEIMEMNKDCIPEVKS